jgi:long-subunit fatty acid transport protein
VPTFSSSSSSVGCPASDDVNVTVQTTYTPDGDVATLTAVNAITGNQVTTYTYEHVREQIPSNTPQVPQVPMGQMGILGRVSVSDAAPLVSVES